MSTPREAHARFRDTTYFPQLDGLRALSVLLVVTVHMHERIWSWLAGELGVSVFFVLSGFLITTLALREEEARGRLCVRAFFVRRAFRILPVYYVALGLYCLLILGLKLVPAKVEPMRAVLPYYLTYFQEVPFFLGDASGGIPLYHSWSLGIEEKFYLLWPLFAFVLAFGRPRLRVYGTLVLAVATLTVPLAPAYARLVAAYFPILVGCVLAFLMHGERGFTAVRTVARPTTFWIAVCVTLHAASPHVDGLHEAYVIAVAVLLASLMSVESRWTRVLSVRPLVFVGTLSYGIYLMHVLCLNAVEKVLRPGEGTLVASCRCWMRHTQGGSKNHSLRMTLDSTKS